MSVRFPSQGQLRPSGVQVLACKDGGAFRRKNVVVRTLVRRKSDIVFQADQNLVSDQLAASSHVLGAPRNK